MNEETFKAAIVELLRCTSNTNVQHHCIGDGEGNVALAGFYLPPAALTDGTKPGAETLFKLSLHEVKGLFESQVYLKNPNAADVAAARIQAAILDGIGCVAKGQPVLDVLQLTPPEPRLGTLLKTTALLIIMTHLQPIILRLIIIKITRRRRKFC